MMQIQCTALSCALDELGATQSELAEILFRRDERRRYDLITKRRALSREVTIVNNLAVSLFEGFGDADLLAAYRRIYAAARSKAAIHQSNWSALRVGEFEDQYRDSARDAGKAHKLFSEWVRAAISTIEKS